MLGIAERRTFQRASWRGCICAAIVTQFVTHFGLLPVIGFIGAVLLVVSVAAIFLVSAELPLVAMIKVVAASMLTTLKIRNLTLFDAGTMS